MEIAQRSTAHVLYFTLFESVLLFLLRSHLTNHRGKARRREDPSTRSPVTLRDRYLSFKLALERDNSSLDPASIESKLENDVLQLHFWESTSSLEKELHFCLPPEQLLHPIYYSIDDKICYQRDVRNGKQGRTMLFSLVQTYPRVVQINNQSLTRRKVNVI